MKVYSKTEEKWLDVQPVVDVNTNKVIGFKKEGGNEILSPDLFYVKEPIDWDHVLVECSIAILKTHLLRQGVDLGNMPYYSDEVVEAAKIFVNELKDKISE